MSGALTAYAVDGVGEIVPGDDLGALVAGLSLTDGDVVTVTSKVLSKSEGRSSTADRPAAVTEESVREVARRGRLRITENRLGLIMAAAGVDASNVAPGTVLLLPLDPDASARRIREHVHTATDRNVAVVVTDTAGRAWRTGQTDIAIGVAGLEPVESFAGRVDGYGNPLAVTAPAVADEVAGLAELVCGKLAGRPVAVVRGLAHRVLAPGVHGPGAVALQRPRREDLFALGSREAVLAAVGGVDPDCFGTPATADELVDTLQRLGAEPVPVDGGVLVGGGPAQRERARIVAHALGWSSYDGRDARLRLVPSAP